MPQYPATIALSALNGTNGFVMPGLNTGDRTGNSVSSAGDINGDGFDDFLIAASSSSTAQSSAGVVYVVFGKDTAFAASFDFTLLDGTNGFRIDPAAAGDEIGSSVSSAGDLNGDGFADIIIGAGSADPGTVPRADAGSAYVIYGQATFATPTLAVADLDGANGITLVGIDAGDLAGTGVGGGGDFNGDGLDDFLVGAPGANGGDGESYVIFGNNTFGLPTELNPSTITGTGGLVPGVILAGGTAPSAGGTSIDFIGDINGDGFDDVIFGAPNTTANGNGGAGAAYVVFGSNSFAGASILPGSLNGSNGFRIDGVGVFDDTGFSVASAGDINADGIADMIIGAPGTGGPGKAYVVFGKSTAYAGVLNLAALTTTDGFSITGLANSNLFGEEVASAGDVNGDGFDDIIVGAREAATNGNAASGESYVIFGKGASFGTSFDLTTLDGTNGFRIEGAAAGDRSGVSVASAGDINGDGLDDLVIGANRAGGGGIPGAAYIVFGQLPDTAVNRVGTGASQSIVGGNFSDILEGAGGDDELWGHDGLDQLDGGTGNDILRGGAGNDLYIVDSVLDQIIEAVSGGTTDRVRSETISLNLANYANVEDAFLIGSASLNLTGNAGVNRLDGNAGANKIIGGGGADSMHGGDGNDTYFVDNESDFVSEANAAAAGGIDRIVSTVTRTLGLNVEQLVLTGATAINGTGNALANTLFGNAGANQLNGLGGNDSMIGGNGNDTYIADSVTDIVVETNALAAGGIDRIVSVVTRTLGANIEQLVLIGTNTINATGNALGNYLVGNSGNNVITGLDGNDVINGAAGNDYITGGAGVDVLTGGAGFDNFVFNTASPSLNRDIITDFFAPQDTIRLENAVFTALGAATGFLAANKFWASATGVAHDADDRIVYNTTTGALIYDVNGSGAGGAFQFATLSSKPTISAADFFVM